VEKEPGIYKRASRAGWWVLLAATLALVVIVRIRLLGLPLERDEGEYAYAGQLMLQGIPPYKLAYSMKFPGTAAAYALLMSIFGQSIAGVHLGLLIVNLATIGLLFFLGRRLLNEIGGIVAATSYAVLSVTPYILGVAAHATHFVVLPVLAGMLLLLRPPDRRSKKIIFTSGAVFGLGLLMKQPGLLFVVFGAAYLLGSDWRAHLNFGQILLRNITFFCGAAVPLAATCLVLWWAGVFQEFWFWTIVYAQQYGTRVPVSYGIRVFLDCMPSVIEAAWPIWILAGLGLVSCALDKNHRSAAGFLVGLLLFSLLAVCPGFYFRPHYFILLLPAISLMAGVALTTTANFLNAHSRMLRFIPILLFGAGLGWPVWTEKDFFFQRSLVEACRMLNGANPFPESIKIAEFLRAQTTEKDTVAVLGSEPQIYFYSQRHSATGYIYTYGLMEPQPYAHKMQQEMIQEIEAARPMYLVLVMQNKSWLAGPDSDLSIFRWAGKYCDANYDEVGLINIDESGTDYYFPVPPKLPKPTSDHILIYRRKT
jgi:Dolichyl-phosphate-mannose-protein mannosyltransferase